MMTDNKDAHQVDSPLLKLPAELQNHIYLYVLIRAYRIKVSKSRWAHHEAPLLSVCRYIRKETTKMYFASNSFQLIFEDYDSSIYARFEGVLKRHGIKHRDISVSIRGDPNWDNLYHWLCRLHKGQDAVPVSSDDFGFAPYPQMETVLYHAQELWKTERWENLQFALRMFRVDLAWADPRWLPQGQTFLQAHRALLKESENEFRRREESQRTQTLDRFPQSARSLFSLS